MTKLAYRGLDTICSTHNVERFYPHEVVPAFYEVYRKLSDDGLIMLTCPDVQSVCKLVADDKLSEPAYNSSADSIALIDLLYRYKPSKAAENL